MLGRGRIAHPPASPPPAGEFPLVHRHLAQDSASGRRSPLGAGARPRALRDAARLCPHRAIGGPRSGSPPWPRWPTCPSTTATSRRATRRAYSIPPSRSTRAARSRWSRACTSSRAATVDATATSRWARRSSRCRSSRSQTASTRALPPETLRAAIGREDEGYIDQRESPAIFLTSAYAPIASGVLLAIFFAFERGLGASRRSALVATALLGACSYVAAHSVYFLQHTTEAVAILGGFAALHAWRRTGRLGWLAAGSALASAVVIVRVPAAVSGPALAGYLLFTLIERRRDRRPRAGASPRQIALPAAAVAVIHLGVNYAKWGTLDRVADDRADDAAAGLAARGAHRTAAEPGRQPVRLLAAARAASAVAAGLLAPAPRRGDRGARTHGELPRGSAAASCSGTASGLRPARATCSR